MKPQIISPNNDEYYGKMELEGIRVWFRYDLPEAKVQAHEMIRTILNKRQEKLNATRA
jgi:hypothetical protein